MITQRLVIRMLLSSLVGIITFSTLNTSAQNNVILYTPNTQISVPPGESIDYSIEVINKSEVVKDLKISTSGIPSSWNYTLQSGAYSIQQISVLPGEKKNLSFKVEVPLKVDKGNYNIKLNAGTTVLPLTINVSKQGSYKTEFTTEQANMEGHSKSDFTFRSKLKNRTGEKQLYALKSAAPRGWSVTFKPNNKQATSVEIEANNTQDVSIEIKPPLSVAAGTYKIPVSATTNLTSADLELEVVITGTYELELTTPRGLVSSNITAGDEKNIDLVVRNTGSAKLSDIKISSSKPTGWEVNFEPEEIPILDPGSSVNIKAKVKADKKAITGDYITNFIAKTPEADSKIAFRMSVKTPLIWGWIGILIILIAIGSILYLFRKYGRR